MTLVDNYGRQRTVRQTVTVNPAPKFTIEQTTTQPRTGQDVVHSADGELDGYQFSWDTDGDSENESRGRKVVTTFEQFGQKPISVVATTLYGVTERRSIIQNNAEFHLSSQQPSAEPGEKTDLSFSVSNQINNESISTKLQLDTPSGLSVSDVSDPGITTVQSRTSSLSTQVLPSVYSSVSKPQSRGRVGSVVRSSILRLSRDKTQDSC